MEFQVSIKDSGKRLTQPSPKSMSPQLRSKCYVGLGLAVSQNHLVKQVLT